MEKQNLGAQILAPMRVDADLNASNNKDMEPNEKTRCERKELSQKIMDLLRGQKVNVAKAILENVNRRIDSSSTVDDVHEFPHGS